MDSIPCMIIIGSCIWMGDKRIIIVPKNCIGCHNLIMGAINWERFDIMVPDKSIFYVIIILTNFWDRVKANLTYIDDNEIIVTSSELEQINNSEEKENNRANISKKKYRKQIEWRQDEVPRLFPRGYSQSEITRQLHTSQPTISRDIEYVRATFSSDPKYYGKRIFTE